MAEFDVVIIGAGPGGYVAAIRAAQLGFTVAIVEKEKALGGTCVRVGCIPSKALLESSERYLEAREHLADHGVTVAKVGLDLAKMHARKDAVVKSNTDGVAYLMKKHKVERVTGTGRLVAAGEVAVDGPDGARTLTATHVVLATGSRVAPLRGVAFDGDRVATSTEALAWPEVPEHLVVVGAGVIGLELGSVWRRLGAQVTVLEYLDRILPGMDDEIAKEAKKLFTKQGMTIRTGVAVTGADVADGRVTVRVDGGEPVVADRVLVATGRVPNTEGLGLEEAGVQVDARGRIVVDERFATSLEGVYAIGDVIHGPMLAHKAEEDGVALAELLATGHGHVDYGMVPSVVYTDPEIAAVGRTEEELKAQGIPYRKGTFAFMANGRARAMGRTEGKVKVLAHEVTDRVLGVHAIGPHAGDLIAEAVAAMAFHASSEDLARVVHAHPTLSEVLKEAALAVDGRALHA
ncbi:MAG: dihydrolipoyl dehydrogenase [Trueperaceae bacterium]|nr:dihydrolipoyl dehydrogenase [Trueperaceae bacterium]